MSRAFIKESDGDRPEDLPDLPLSAYPNYVTARGLAQLRSRLIDAEAALVSTGDSTVSATMERARLARDARWLQARIAAAIPVIAGASGDQVDFGASVELVDEAGAHYVYRIVGEDEADPEHGLVSWISPLARALHGARVGDSVTWKRPAGDLVVKILKIDYASTE